MSLNRIKKIERIAILSRLVEKYCVNADIIEIVRLAKDLANVIDELNYLNIDLAKLAHEFLIFFPEHWKKRTQFLLIVTKYWKEILKERNLLDVEVSRCNSSTLVNPIHYSFDLFQKVSIFDNENIYDEIDLVITIIQEFIEERISIISPSRDFSRYLTTRLDAEGIGYFSRCGSNAHSQEIMDRVIQNFNNRSDEELKRLAKELSDVVEDDITDEPERSRKVLLLPPIEIYKVPRNEITIYTELNESVWKQREAGYFWLHHMLRKKLGLLHDTAFIENLFYHGITRSKNAYLLRSLKSDGQNNKKSSILAKFEAIAEKENISLNFMSPNKIVENSITVSEHCKFNLPKELDAWDVELLIKDPYAFFAKKILGLHPPELEPNRQKIRHHFKMLAKCQFRTQTITAHLEALKNLDFFAYHKALKLIDVLKKINSDDKPSYNDLCGKITLSEVGISLCGQVDKIVENDDYSTLISLRSSGGYSTKEIIYDGCSALLALCLIAEQQGFNEKIKPIRNIQIWNLMAIEEDKIIDKEIEISKEILDEFSKRLNSNLELYLGDHAFEIDCNTGLKGIYNGYKHFKRH